MSPDDELVRTATAAFSEPFDGVLCIRVDDGPTLWIDGRASPPAIADTPPAGLPADERGCCFWFVARDALMRMFEEERRVAGSFVSGRLAVAGDMSVMSRLRFGERNG